MRLHKRTLSLGALLHSLSMYLYSLLFCLRYLPFKQAIKVPVYISQKVRIQKLRRGDIVFACEPRRSMALIGFEGNKGLEQQKAVIYVEKGGKIVFHGYCRLLAGTSFFISGGILSVGNNVLCNNNCYFSCNKGNIEIGDDSLFGWNIVLNTSNGHAVYMDGVERNMEGDITIGHHVWVCSYCHIAKNVRIADGCIVAQDSLVLKDQLTPNSLIAGNPAKTVRGNVDWAE